ncbi:chaperonin GroES [Evansella vedderi]|uniref:Co-chaperonin GroES n=1 Tax=Evansella vedderi TaxID=38282 RepID=A0ABU0A2Q5_9BACI|nr:co-chaperone GroES [Evansella vedderi]MDQ0257774.1 chaperonin GroES [Evansella vedderi]
MIKPLGNRVVIEVRKQEEMTASGIVLPDKAKEKPTEGTVVAVGQGTLLDNGKHMPLEVKEGDLILFNKYAGTEVKLDGKEYLILKESDILAIVEDQKEGNSAEKEMVANG